MDSLAHADDILVDPGATSRDHALDTLVLANLFDNQGGLHRKLSHRDENQSLNLVQTCIDLLDQRYAVGCSFASSILRLGDDVLAVENLRNSLLLDRGWKLEAHLEDALHRTSWLFIERVDHLQIALNRPS